MVCWVVCLCVCILCSPPGEGEDPTGSSGEDGRARKGPQPEVRPYPSQARRQRRRHRGGAGGGALCVCVCVSVCRCGLPMYSHDGFTIWTRQPSFPVCWYNFLLFILLFPCFLQELSPSASAEESWTMTFTKLTSQLSTYNSPPMSSPLVPVSSFSYSQYTVTAGGITKYDRFWFSKHSINMFGCPKLLSKFKFLEKIWPEI